MLTEPDVLKRLDSYLEFITISHPYVYLIDCRLNVFRNDNDQWCIVSEVLGYNPRGDIIILSMETFGNSFLQYQDDVSPVDQKIFLESTDGEALKADAKHWLVRGKKVKLTHKRQDYERAGIELREHETGEIAVEEAARLVILKHRNLFRATDEELYKLVSSDMKKILVIDEWHHRHYEPINDMQISEEVIIGYYELYSSLYKHSSLYKEEEYVDYDTFAKEYKKEEQRKYDESVQKWGMTRPSSYETWQQIAKVIVTGDTSSYKPTLAPNTHWKNWTESGSM